MRPQVSLSFLLASLSLLAIGSILVFLVRKPQATPQATDGDVIIVSSVDVPSLSIAPNIPMTPLKLMDNQVATESVYPPTIVKVALVIVILITIYYSVQNYSKSQSKSLKDVSLLKRTKRMSSKVLTKSTTFFISQLVSLLHLLIYLTRDVYFIPFLLGIITYGGIAYISFYWLARSSGGYSMTEIIMSGIIRFGLFIGFLIFIVRLAVCTWKKITTNGWQIILGKSEQSEPGQQPDSTARQSEVYQSPTSATGQEGNPNTQPTPQPKDGMCCRQRDNKK